MIVEVLREQNGGNNERKPRSLIVRSDTNIGSRRAAEPSWPARFRPTRTEYGRGPVLARLVSTLCLFALLGVAAVPPTLAAPKSELDASWAVEEGYSLRVLARGFSLPTSLAAVPQASAEPGAPKLFVTELRGAIKVIANDDSVSEFARITTFAPKKDWPDLQGEAGMAGICLDPDHGYIFVTYAYRDASGVLRNGISRLRAQPHTFAGKVQEQRDIGRFLAGETSAFSHQIGNCVVHDGLLYVSIGDAGNPSLSANVESSLGKVLRLTLDGEPAPGNPFASGAALAPRVFAFGLRNTFGLAFARQRLFAAENGVGLDRFLELRAGRDYHWNGTDASIAMNAAAVFVPTIGPVQMVHVAPGTDGLRPSDHDRFLIAASNGEQGPGVVVVDYSLADSSVLAAPRYLVRFEGQKWGVAVTGVALTRDGVCFVPILPVDGSGVVLVTRYQPAAAHGTILGKSIKGNLLAASGCLGCHSRSGAGGRVGPALDNNSLRTRIETRVLSAGYAEQVARLDAINDATVAAGRDARHEVLAAGPDARVRVWVINRLLNPKFDEPDAQMPNLNLTRETAESLAAELLGPGKGNRWLAIVSEKGFLKGALAGAFAAALLALVVALFRRPLGRILLRARPRARS
ncbi:MAG TPA: PQQ-dependent sugar dehydrogenase [Ramlibacter sp.]|nr:PQQ-dependent sugar dehydrogenase [Ramlibacter sp.]